jgi:hypothetical protein
VKQVYADSKLKDIKRTHFSLDTIFTGTRQPFAMLLRSKQKFIILKQYYLLLSPSAAAAASV